VLKSLFGGVLRLNHFSEKFGTYITFWSSLVLKSLFEGVCCLNHFSEKFGA